MCAAKNHYYFGALDPVQAKQLGLNEIEIDPLSVLEYNNKYKRTLGQAGLSFFSAGPRRTVPAAVSDGDGVRIGLWGNLGTRLLNIDTPEMSYKLLITRSESDGSSYTKPKSLDGQEWAAFMANPFTMTSVDYLGQTVGKPMPPFGLSPGLYEYLQPHLNSAAATNHRAHAYAAQRHLEALIQWDIENVKDQDGNLRYAGDIEAFRFFMTFAHETMEAYGRLLCILKPDEPGLDKDKRQKSYNIRMIESGMALPYVIWPNLEPWRKQEMILDAVFEPAEVPLLLAKTVYGQPEKTTLGKVRDAVIAARNNSDGVFGPILDAQGNQITGKLALQPNEIRFLGRRRPPSRYLIDLSQTPPFDGKIIHPENYYRVNVENRLYIPIEYVPLFVERGWQKQTSVNG